MSPIAPPRRRPACPAPTASFLALLLPLLVGLLSAHAAVAGEPARFDVVDSRGQEIPAAELRTEGRVSVVAFVSSRSRAAGWVKPFLRKVPEVVANSQVRLVQVDRPGAFAPDLQSPISRQYALDELPTLCIYDPLGREEARGRDARRSLFEDLLPVPMDPSELPGLDEPFTRHRVFETRGETMDLEALGVPGRFSVVLLTAPGLPGDSALRTELRTLSEKRPDIYTSVVSLAPEEGDWSDTALAKELGLEELPQVRLLGPDRRPFLTGEPARRALGELLASRGEARAPPAESSGDAASPVEEELARFHDVASGGEEVSLEDLEAAGEYRLVVFSSRFAEGNGVLRRYLRQFTRYRTNVRIYWVNVDSPDDEELDPSTPVFRQHDLESLPHLVLDDPRGRRLGEGDEALTVILEQLFPVPAPTLEGGPAPGFERITTGGESLDFAPEGAPGWFSVFVLCADDVEGCAFLEPFLKRLSSIRSNVRVSLVDVAPGEGEGSLQDSPILAERGVTGLPHPYLYGPEGTLFQEGAEALEFLQSQFASIPPAEEGEGPFPVPPDDERHVYEITRGNRVELKDYLIPGKTVVFDFHSPFCGPCIQLEPVLKELAEARTDVVVRKVNINRPGTWGIDGGSPVARQFGIYSVPHFVVHGPDGSLKAAGMRAYREVLRLMQLPSNREEDAGDGAGGIDGTQPPATPAATGPEEPVRKGPTPPPSPEVASAAPAPSLAAPGGLAETEEPVRWQLHLPPEPAVGEEFRLELVLHTDPRTYVYGPENEALEGLSVVPRPTPGVRWEQVELPPSEHKETSIGPVTVSAWVYRGERVFELRGVVESAEGLLAPLTVDLEYLHCVGTQCASLSTERSFTGDWGETVGDRFPAAPGQPAEEPGASGIPEAAPRGEGGFSRELESGLLWALLIAYLWGLGASLSPCVYPMIPVTIAFFGGQTEERSRARTFLLAATYVLGIVFTYALVGVAAARAGRDLGSLLVHPLVVGLVSATLVAMGLSLFGLFELRLPQSLQDRLAGGEGKGFLGAFFTGAVLGLVAAPCVGPFAASILLFVARSGDVWLGFLALASFGLGMGTLFLVLAMGVSSLPRSGPWMVAAKKFFGWVLFGAAIWFLAPLLPAGSMLLLWGSWLGIGGALGGAFDEAPDPAQKARRALTVLALAAGIYLVVAGVARFVPLRPGATPAAPPAAAGADGLPWVHDLETARRRARETGKPIFADFWATWCTPCLKMKHEVFPDPTVRELLGDFVLLELDCTQPDSPGARLKNEELKAFSMPYLAIFDADGRHRPELSYQGYLGTEDFADFLRRARTAL